MPYKIIDLETYPRRAHFEYFASMPNPYFGVTVNVDVTSLVSKCKTEGHSFYMAFMRRAALALNRVPELRRRIIDGAIAEYDFCATSHIELLEDGTYCYCTLKHDMDEEDYYPYAENERKKARERASIEEDEDVNSLIFISTLPWLNYTALVQPTGNDSNPRITWGKYEEDFKGRLMMPVSLLVHHALADGAHAALFYRYLGEELQK